MIEYAIPPDVIAQVYERLKREGEEFGYYLNPEADFSRDLVKGLLVNERRYGYRACPCRLADGDRRLDQDIICPCDYRDADLVEYGVCYCGLYVSEEVARGSMQIGSIPERRPVEKTRTAAKPAGAAFGASATLPVWRCKVCGYLCARDRPPGVCPICKAGSDRFEIYIAGGDKPPGIKMYSITTQTIKEET